VQRICYRWDARFFLVIVQCPDSISKKRFEERAKKNRRTLSDANWSVYEKFKQIFEPTNLHHINVNVTNDYREIVRKIDNVIKKYSIK
jgi:predicted kinase